jgi:hypothetical protein
MSNDDLLNRLSRLEGEVRELRDKEEIRALKARYSHYVDGGWPNHGGSHMGPVHELFVEDGVWDASPGLPVARGREAIRRIFVDLRSLPFAFHNAVSPMIEVRGDTATGHWHFIGASEMPDGACAWFLGTYEERYVRTRDGWRYQLMKYHAVRQAKRPQGWGPPPGDQPMGTVDFKELGARS